MRPILVTQRVVLDGPTGEMRDALDVRWAAFLAAAGLLPILVPSGVGIACFLAKVNWVGLLLTGGNTVNGDPLSLRRDAMEAQILDAAHVRGVPVLGVCRGAQFIAHRRGMPLECVAGHVRTRHRIAVHPTSRWLRAHDGLDVNSFHDFGIGGSGHLVVANAMDGAVEAIEDPVRPVLGIMWHPEREEPPCMADVALFQGFFGKNT